MLKNKAFILKTSRPFLGAMEDSVYQGYSSFKYENYLYLLFQGSRLDLISQRILRPLSTLFPLEVDQHARMHSWRVFYEQNSVNHP